MPMKMPVRRKRNPIIEIDHVTNFKDFRRCVEKRGNGLHKKAMEFALKTGAEVFLSIRMFDRVAGRNTALTFTTRTDRDWRKHLEKILSGKFKTMEGIPSLPVRLDTATGDYERIFDPVFAPIPSKKFKTRDIKRPWFWKPTTADILYPQLSTEHTKKTEDLQNSLQTVRTEISNYFGDDKEDLEDSRVITEPCGSEEQTERDTIHYNKQYFSSRPLRVNWMVTEAASITTKRIGWSLLHELIRTSVP
jgi:hypothetical protein